MSVDKIKNATVRIINRLPAARGRGEESTKQALVLPMLDALGFDIWDPAEVCPEFEADFATKKSGQKEKVDIALLLNNAPYVFIEVKSVDSSLDGHEGQLARYFNSTSSVTLGVLTNGIEWRLYTDTVNPNIMDSQPFHVVNLEALDQGLEVMARFSKPSFSPETIRDFATELLYTANIAAFLRTEIDLRDKDPSEQFIRWILKSEKMYDGVVNQNVVERFRPIVKAALTRVIRDVVRRSVVALDTEAARNNQENLPTKTDDLEAVESASVPTSEPVETNAKRAIVTTENELALFSIAEELFNKSLHKAASIYDPSSRKDIPVSIAYKDTTGYFGLYLNKPSWWILRAVTESKTQWIGFNIPIEIGATLVPQDIVRLEPNSFAEFRVAISSYNDLWALKDLFIATIDALLRERSQAYPIAIP